MAERTVLLDATEAVIGAHQRWKELSGHGKVFEAVVHDRVDYAASMTDGRTALEIAPTGPAAAETAQLWSLLRAHLDSLANMRELANVDKSVINV